MDLTHLPQPHAGWLVLEKGIIHPGVWSLQFVLKNLGWQELVIDGNFGSQTDGAVHNFQRNMGLRYIDGKVGPETSHKLISLQCAPIYAANPTLPHYILESVVAGESGFELASLNWSSEGGVDVCAFQRHVWCLSWVHPWPDYNAVFEDVEVQRALRLGYQARLLGSALKDRHDRWFRQPGAPTHEKAWRLAIFAHNRPSSAAILAASKEEDLAAYWKQTSQWVINLGGQNGPLKFKDGTLVLTPLDQAKFYALGAPEHGHNGIACSLVETWT